MGPSIMSLVLAWEPQLKGLFKVGYRATRIQMHAFLFMSPTFPGVLGQWIGCRTCNPGRE